MPNKKQNQKTEPKMIEHIVNGVRYLSFDGGQNWIADYGRI